MNQLPSFIPFLFIATVILSILWFYRASRSKSFLAAALSWAVIQSILSESGLYQKTETLPPNLMIYGVFPTLILMAVVFSTRRGRDFIDRIDLGELTLFHTIRIPVELTLFLLYGAGVMSVYITFEGTNYDIFSGLTAPVIYYLVFRNRRLTKGWLVGWNIFCLLLLLNVVVTAIFSIPSPLQRLAFDQPNIAVLYFPYALLPTLIVPLALFGHLVAFRQLSRKIK